MARLPEIQLRHTSLCIATHPAAAKEAKRWTMLMIRGKNRKETEGDVVWELEPSLSPRHMLKLSWSDLYACSAARTYFD